MKKIIALVLTFVMVLSVSVSAADFTDVAADYWGAEYINEMESKGVVNGYPEGDFRPENPVTYAEFAKMLSILSGANIAEDNEASGEEWYEKYMTAAESFFSFSAVEFDPNADAAREDVASAIVLALKLKDGDKVALYERFSDSADIDPDKAPLVAAAVDAEIINGYPDGTFMPEATITRAEVCAMLSRAFAKDEEKPVVTGKPEGSNTTGGTDKTEDEVEKEALPPVTYTISTDKTEYSAGDKVYFTVAIDSTAHLATSQMVVNYDPTYFDIVEENQDYVNEEWLSAYYDYDGESFFGTLFPHANPKKGKISVINLRTDGSSILPENAVENMEIFKIELTVKENVSGKAKFFIDGIVCGSNDGAREVIIANDVTVTIK